VTTGEEDSSGLWLLLAAFVVFGIVALVMVLRHRRSAHAAAQWRRIARPAYDDAAMVRDLYAASAATPGGGPATTQVEDAATALDRAATNAPDKQRWEAAEATAAALRGLRFAIEAETLLHAGTPTAAQLAEADATRRARTDDLDRAVAQLGELVRDPAETPATATTTPPPTPPAA
jgi:hypothetical protein